MLYTHEFLYHVQLLLKKYNRKTAQSQGYGTGMPPYTYSHLVSEGTEGFALTTPLTFHSQFLASFLWKMSIMQCCKILSYMFVYFPWLVPTTFGIQVNWCSLLSNLQICNEVRHMHEVNFQHRVGFRSWTKRVLFVNCMVLSHFSRM